MADINLMMQLSKMLTNQNIKDIKSCLPVFDFGFAEIEKMEDFHDIWKALEIGGIIKAGDYGSLRTMLNRIGHRQAAKTVEDFDKQCKNATGSTNAEPCVENTPADATDRATLGSGGLRQRSAGAGYHKHYASIADYIVPVENRQVSSFLTPCLIVCVLTASLSMLSAGIYFVIPTNVDKTPMKKEVFPEPSNAERLVNSHENSRHLVEQLEAAVKTHQSIDVQNVLRAMPAIETTRATIIDTSRGYRRQPVIVSAARDGDFDIVKALVEGGGNVNQCSGDGETALWWAGRQGHLAIVEYLVREGNANVNLGNEEGITCLMAAASSGQHEVVKYLLDEGALPNVSDKLGNTALHRAAGNGHLQVVKALLNGKAKFDMTNNAKLTPVEYAESRLKNKPESPHADIRGVVTYLNDWKSRHLNI